MTTERTPSSLRGLAQTLESYAADCLDMDLRMALTDAAAALLRSEPVEEPVARFLAMARAHAHPVPADRLAEHRVPPGTRFVGRLYIAPDGELVVTDGFPVELPDDDSLVHDCDEMGCSTAFHVVARLPLPHATTESEEASNA